MVTWNPGENFFGDLRFDPNSRLFGRTDLWISLSRAKFDDEADFEIRLAVACQKTRQTKKKPKFDDFSLTALSPDPLMDINQTVIDKFTSQVPDTPNSPKDQTCLFSAVHARDSYNQPMSVILQVQDISAPALLSQDRQI